MATPSIRLHGYVEFDEGVEPNGWRLSRGRGKTFLVEWCDAAAGSAPLPFSADDEIVAVFPFAGGVIERDGRKTSVPGRSITIVPRGSSSFSCDGQGSVILLSPLRTGEGPAGALNDRDYPEPGPEDMLTVPSPTGADRGLQIIPVDRIVPPADKPRLKIVRSETMSVSWIEYEGVRDRTSLSPHEHADFEQGSLAIEGRFIHHLRVPWGPDATRWRDDVHLEAACRSLCVIPPHVIHTTEGQGGGRHILLDIFAPPRADFIDKDWVFNQPAYRA